MEIHLSDKRVYQDLAVDRQPLQANELAQKEFLRNNCVQS
jgi:hypothetical protein